VGAPVSPRKRGAAGAGRPFNSPLEVGLRALFLLAASAPREVDLQRLVTFDYLAVHSADAEGPPSLHPELPFRGGEWLVRRETVRAGLDLMFAKELIEKQFAPAGISYLGTDVTVAFLGYLTSPYAAELRARSQWVVGRFGTLDDERLAAFMREKVGRWGAEFTREPLHRSWT